MGEVINLQNEKQWKEFLASNDHMVFHTPEYKKFINKAFKCKTLYLAYVEGSIKTIFPFYSISHFLGNKVISTAYIEYGGPCGNLNFVPDIVNYVYGTFNRVDYIEVREGLEGYDDVLSELMMKSVDYKRYVLPLYDEETTFGKIEKAKRKTIRKAEKAGVVTRDISREELDVFYDLYFRNMDNFGSPPYSRKYFDAFFDKILSEGMGKIMGAYVKNKLVAGLVGFCYGDRIHVIIAVSDPKYQEYRVNDAIHWAFIKYGCLNKFKFFDFGRVREESGQAVFKKRFGADSYDLNHYYLLIKSKCKPVVDPSNIRYRFKMLAWRMLPGCLKRRLGHWVREGLGI